MKAIILDTNVWSEYWKTPDKKLQAHVETLIEEGVIACCLPIQAELAAAPMDERYRKLIASSLSYAIEAPLDFNDPAVWAEAAKLAQIARRKKIPAGGTIARLILLATMQNSMSLWTFDAKLRVLAHHFGVLWTP